MRIFSVKPSSWEVDHTSGILQGLQYQTTHDQALPDTPMWRMLESRFEAHPMNFEIWHPNIARMIENSFTYSTHCEFPTPTVEIPCLPNTWVECPPPVQLANQTVPEPTTALMFGIGIILSAIFKIWSRG